MLYRVAFLMVYLIIAYYLQACTSSKNDDKSKSSDVVTVEKIDTLTPLGNAEALQGEIKHAIVSSPYFRNKLSQVNDSLLVWGFTDKSEKKFTEQAEFNSHWLLKNYKNEAKLKRMQALYPEIVLPSSVDWKGLVSVKQIVYKKAWKYVIEEWRFLDETSARRWLSIALTSNYINDKPPRTYWVNDGKLYFIMATASIDWSEHSAQLVRLFTSKSKKLIQLMNHPLDLKAFKKGMKGSNSSGLYAKDYYPQPDTVGQFFNYFWFHKLRREYGEQVAYRGMNVSTYIYDSEIGYYLDVDEKLVGITGNLNTEYLGALDLVGKNRQAIESDFGIDYLSRDQIIVYMQNRTLLVIEFDQDKVTWFRFLRTNLSINNISDIPEEILDYKNTI